MIDELKTKNIYFVYDQGFRIFRGRRHQLRNPVKKVRSVGGLPRLVASNTKPC